MNDSKLSRPEPSDHARPDSPEPQQGRPAVLDPTKRQRIAALLAVGCSRRVAARYVGCSPSTITRTAARDPASRGAKDSRGICRSATRELCTTILLTKSPILEMPRDCPVDRYVRCYKRHPSHELDATGLPGGDSRSLLSRETASRNRGTLPEKPIAFSDFLFQEAPA